MNGTAVLVENELCNNLATKQATTYLKIIIWAERQWISIWIDTGEQNKMDNKFQTIQTMTVGWNKG